MVHYNQMIKAVIFDLGGTIVDKFSLTPVSLVQAIVRETIG